MKFLTLLRNGLWGRISGSEGFKLALDRFTAWQWMVGKNWKRLCWFEQASRLTADSDSKSSKRKAETPLRDWANDSDDNLLDRIQEKTSVETNTIELRKDEGYDNTAAFNRHKEHTLDSTATGSKMRVHVPSALFLQNSHIERSTTKEKPNSPTVLPIPSLSEYNTHGSTVDPEPDKEECEPSSSTMLTSLDTIINKIFLQLQPEFNEGETWATPP